MSNLASLALFAVFVALAAFVRASHGAAARRRAVNGLIVYTLAVFAVLIVLRRDAWPFTTYGVFTERSDANRPFTSVRFTGVDAAGGEHLIDARAWSPLNVRTLDVWWLVDFLRLSEEQQRTVMEFLYEKAERARTRRPWPLRLVAAPPWYAADPQGERPATPYVGLRVDLVTRIPSKKAATGTESLKRMAEFHR